MAVEGSVPDRMLILACSQRKRRDKGLLPAVERYDGPAFRVLRRFLRESSSRVPDVLILSAEHGLIPHDLPIADYDRKMTPTRARELRPRIFADLERLIAPRASLETLICAGKQYLPALQADDASPLSKASVRTCDGALGRKLAELHDWLHGHSPKLRYNSSMLIEGNGACIRGVEVTLTPDQVFDIAAEALAEGWGDPERYESWCVPMNGRYVAPKWLVSQISGLPVRAFTTDESRRLLAQLGVEVRRA